MPSTRIYLADDHELVRKGVKLLLAERADFDVAAEARDGLELLALLKHSPLPDVIIIDISMPKLRGIEAIREIKALYPQVKMLMLTMHKDEDFLCEAFVAGAEGYLLKEDVVNELFTALDTILRGDLYISPLLGKELKDSWMKMFRQKKGFPAAETMSLREKEVLKLIAEGNTNKEIAEKLCISVRTVDHHRANIMEKFNFKNSAELVRYAITKGHIS